LRVNDPVPGMDSAAAALACALEDRYRIVCEIGRGAVSTVFLAMDLKHGRQVAVKVLRLEDAQDFGKDRFLREIELVASLRHPHILPLHDSSVSDGVLYFVMPYLEEGSLRARLERTGPLFLPHAVQMVREVADALDYAHRHDVVHRDVKPENILLEDRHAIVADFGIARPVGMRSSASRSTQEGLILGTPQYMSPEQAISGEDIDRRSDVYSLGCVLFELLTGEPPFTGSPTSLLLQRLTGEARLLSTVMAAVPAGLEETVRRALARDPDDRFQSAKEFADALGDATEVAPRDGSAPVFGLSGTRPTSLGVLPLVNLSAEVENEYFGEAMTEELINACAKIQGLRVASRTSAFSFRGKNLDAREIGRRLNVGALLEGSVRKSKDSFRITVQLIGTRDGLNLWSESYDRKLIHVFEVQEELARAIASALSMTLVGKETPLVRPLTDNMEAYHLYLKGRFFLNKRIPDSMRRAIEYFGQAIRADPSYALAYSGLADSYHLLAIYCAMLPKEAYPHAKIAAAKGLALNDSLPETHVSAGCVALAYDRDWITAERECRRAIELDPSHALAHHWLGWCLVSMGCPEASREARRAMELEPLAPIIHARAGHILSYAGLPEEGAAASLRALELDPHCAVAFETLAYAYCHPRIRRFDEAISVLKQALSLPEGTAQFFLPMAHALNGDRVEAMNLLKGLRLNVESGRRPPSYTTMWVSGAYAILGNMDEAFRWLELSCADRAFSSVLLNIEHAYDPLRSDPRYAVLLREVGLDRNVMSTSS
jgi:serine/threonine protein kinase